MSKKDRIDAAGAAGLVGFAMLLAINQVLIKIVNVGLQPVFVAGLRSALAVLGIVVWVALRGDGLRFSAGTARAGILAGVIFSTEFLCLFLALDRTTVVRTSIIFYSMPVWMALMAHIGLPGEKITQRKAIGLLLAFAGTVLAILDRGSSAGVASISGDLLALAAAICWAGTAFVVRASALVRERPVMQLFWMVLVSAPLLLLVSPLFGEIIRDLQPIHLWIVIFQGIVVVAAGYIFWFWLLSIYPASSVASFSFLTPVFGVALGWLALGEPLGPGILLAGVLVAGGIILVNRKQKT